MRFAVYLLEGPNLVIPWGWVAGSAPVVVAAVAAAARYVFKWIREGQIALIAAQERQIAVSNQAIELITKNIGSEVRAAASAVNGLTIEIRSGGGRKRATRPTKP